MAGSSSCHMHLSCDGNAALKPDEGDPVPFTHPQSVTATQTPRGQTSRMDKNHPDFKCDIATHGSAAYSVEFDDKTAKWTNKPKYQAACLVEHWLTEVVKGLLLLVLQAVKVMLVLVLDVVAAMLGLVLMMCRLLVVTVLPARQIEAGRLDEDSEANCTSDAGGSVADQQRHGAGGVIHLVGATDGVLASGSIAEEHCHAGTRGLLLSKPPVGLVSC
eukprot:jgi/Chrzof1/1906/Cz10g25200.t1